MRGARHSRIYTMGTAAAKPELGGCSAVLPSLAAAGAGCKAASASCSQYTLTPAALPLGAAGSASSAAGCPAAASCWLLLPSIGRSATVWGCQGSSSWGRCSGSCGRCQRARHLGGSGNGSSWRQSQACAGAVASAPPPAAGALCGFWRGWSAAAGGWQAPPHQQQEQLQQQG